MQLADVKKIAVLGAGTMGPGIAQSFALAGFDVSMYSRTESTLEKARLMVKTNLETFFEEDLISCEDIESAMDRISFVNTVTEAVQGVQVVIETIAEKPDLKRQLFNELDALLPEGVIFASNASSLNPFELIPERRLPYATTSHYFAPAHIIPLVEVVKGEKTTENTMSIMIELLKKCNKVPVRLEKFIPGYIINRIQILLNTEIFNLLDNGYCTAEQLDLAVKASLMPRGMVLGLVQRYDFTGLDVSANNIINASYVMPETSKRPASLFDRVDKGELGVKTGKGFYDYSGRSTEEINKKRDKMLFRVFKATQDLINEQI